MASNLKSAPGALTPEACDWLVNWMDSRQQADTDAFRAGDFLQHYWKDRSEREILAALFDEIFRLRRIVVDLESDMAAHRARQAVYKRGVTVADIVEAAGIANKALPASIRSRDSDHRVVSARQIAVFVAKSIVGFSIQQIAPFLLRHEVAEIQRMFDLAEVRRKDTGFQRAIDATVELLRAAHG